MPALAVVSVPLQPSEPVPPLALQLVALLVDHDSVVACPVCTVAGVAANEPMLGGGLAATVTVTALEVLAGLEPGAPAQVSV